MIIVIPGDDEYAVIIGEDLADCLTKFGKEESYDEAEIAEFIEIAKESRDYFIVESIIA